MKRCSKCGVEKPLEDFYKQTNHKDGRQSRCKTCGIADDWKRYGINITEDQYQLLFRAQDGRCYWCRNKAGRKRLAVDHDHETGEPRSLTCGTCNRRLIGSAEHHWRKGEPVLPCLVEYFTNPPARAILGGQQPRTMGA